MTGIGIDTGGTCTDAVIFDFDTGRVLAFSKALTTKENLEVGIANALDALPRSLTEKAQQIVLSTTLATNACLENKGARAKLLMIGFYPDLMEHLSTTYASYGLQEQDRLIFLDAKVEGLYSDPFDPDWEDLKNRAGEYFAGCDSVGIVQKHPRANGGRFELKAREILSSVLDIPVTVSYDISNETDILRTCAGTMLNARLIPLIKEFTDAVANVMKRRGLLVPVSIVRSDGTMMPEAMAQRFPVETILSGPAASTVGGNTLAGEKSAIVVDMGGTTTDISIVKDRIPVSAQEGIRIGRWKTMVKGLFAETEALGGDSGVRYKDHEIFLDRERVIPLSVLAERYSGVTQALEKLDREKMYSIAAPYEFYVLQKDISEDPGYTDYEKELCARLKDGPLITFELAQQMNRYAKMLGTGRLEAAGVIIKSGLTPTDMMILKGDFSFGDGRAAALALRSLALNTGIPAEEIPDLVYELVWEKMYFAIGRVLLRRQFPDMEEALTEGTIRTMLRCFYSQAKEADKETPGNEFARVRLRAEYPLVGVGAPVHVFLPKVGKLLGTKVIIPEHAQVANALGAAACPKTVSEELKIRAVYENAMFKEYTFSADGRPYHFENIDDAVRTGSEILMDDVRRKAAMREMKEPVNVELSREEYRLDHKKDGLLFEVTLRAFAAEASWTEMTD